MSSLHAEGERHYFVTLISADWIIWLYFFGTKVKVKVRLCLMKHSGIHTWGQEICSLSHPRTRYRSISFKRQIIWLVLYVTHTFHILTFSVLTNKVHLLKYTLLLSASCWLQYRSYDLYFEVSFLVYLVEHQLSSGFRQFLGVPWRKFRSTTSKALPFASLTVHFPQMNLLFEFRLCRNR